MTDHIREVFVADFRHLARFVTEHLGEVAAIEERINVMATDRAEAWTNCMLEAYQGGEAQAEAKILRTRGELQ